MRAASPTIAVVLALGLSGCALLGDADTEFQGEEEAVAETVRSLQTAAVGRDGAEVCSALLTEELAERVSRTGTTCPREMEQAIADADLFELTVLDVEIDGDSATARVENSGAGDDGVTGTVQLERSDGNWRIGGIETPGD